MLQSRVKVDVELATDDEEWLDTEVTTIHMSGNLTGAHFKDLDKDNSKVRFDMVNGGAMTFKNDKGYKKANDPDVFVGDTADGKATVDMVKQDGDLFASIVDTSTNKVTQIGPDADDKIVVTEKKHGRFP